MFGCDPETDISAKLLSNSGKTNLDPEPDLNLLMPPREKGWSHCMKDNTILSDDSQNYRHVLVDTENDDIIYFCDRTPFRPGMHCYTSKNYWRWTGKLFRVNYGSGNVQNFL